MAIAREVEFAKISKNKYNVIEKSIKNLIYLYQYYYKYKWNIYKIYYKNIWYL